MDYLASRWRVCFGRAGSISSARSGLDRSSCSCASVRPLLALGARRAGSWDALRLCHLVPTRRTADDGAGTDGPPTLADGGKPLADLDCDCSDELYAHLGTSRSAGHDHLGPVGQADGAGHVGRQLRPVAVVEGGYGGRPPPWSAETCAVNLACGLSHPAWRGPGRVLISSRVDAPDEAADVVAGAAPRRAAS